MIGKFPLYFIAQVVKTREDNYIEYSPIFPISLFKLGYAYFRIELVNRDRSRLIAFIQVGSEIKFLDKVLDFLVVRVIGIGNIQKHIREKGINVKSYLELWR